SSRFISLSGISGVSAGIFALVGAVIARFRLKEFYTSSVSDSEAYYNLSLYLLALAACVLLCSLLSAYYFTSKKAKKDQQKIWTNTSKKLLLNLAIPLASGGIVCLAMI